MTHVFHRNLRYTPPLAVSGCGMYITDADGKQYLDACGGAAVSCLGHGHPDVLAAMHEQTDRLAYAHTSFFSSQPAEALADQLIRTAPEGMSRVYFVSGGSEAIEAALKMARQYFVEIGEPQRSRFIARRQSYHGNTLGALAVGGNAWRRQQFAPLLIDVDHVSPCYPYRDQHPFESTEVYGTRLAAELDEKIRAVGPKQVIAFVAETVGGATSGALVPVPGYFRAIREVCDRHGVLLILDEVMCGMGRTGTTHAWEQEVVAPDIQAIAKGLGGGYQPIGAMLASGKIIDTIRAGSGAFQHGHTYLAHPLACAAALAVQDVIREDGLLDRVKERGRQLEQRLTERFGNHRHIGDVRGRGLFWAIELVADRASRTSFDPALKLNQKIKAEAFANGLGCYPGGGTVDGVRGDHVLLAPPYIASADEIDLIVEKLGTAVDNVLRSANH
jgi:adenosylmethionine-8-amino-7-oxononanoate aminotransferase